MRIIVITLAILMAGCSNYDSCYTKNFDAHYEALTGEWDYSGITNGEKAKWIVWSDSKRKWNADQYASGQCLNIN